MEHRFGLDERRQRLRDTIFIIHVLLISIRNFHVGARRQARLRQEPPGLRARWVESSDGSAKYLQRRPCLLGDDAVEEVQLAERLVHISLLIGWSGFRRLLRCEVCVALFPAPELLTHDLDGILSFLEGRGGVLNCLLHRPQLPLRPSDGLPLLVIPPPLSHNLHLKSGGGESSGNSRPLFLLLQAALDGPHDIPVNALLPELADSRPQQLAADRAFPPGPRRLLEVHW